MLTCYTTAVLKVPEEPLLSLKGSVHLNYILYSNLVLRLNVRTSVSWKVFKLSPISI